MRTALKHDDSQWGSGRNSKVGTKLALLLSGDDGMVQTALISPLLASIALAFPAASAMLVNCVMAITALTMSLAMLLTSVLARYINKKKIIIFGTALFMVAGFTAMFVPSIEGLIVWRAVLGIGAGLSFPLIPSSISYLFKEREKDQMLGWVIAVGTLFSFILSIAAGWLATFSWRLVFVFYLMFLPVLILQIIFIPNFKPERQEAKEKKQTKERVKKYANLKMGFAALCAILFMILTMVSTFRLSFVVELNGIGDSTISGMGISCITIGSFLMSALFANYLGVFKRFAPFLSIAFSVIGYILLSMATNVWMIFAGRILQGLSMGSMLPFLMSYMSRVAPDSKKTLGMTLMGIAQLGGQVLTPYFISFATAIGFTTDSLLFSFTAGIFGVGAVITLVFAVFLTIKDSSMHKRVQEKL